MREQLERRASAERLANRFELIQRRERIARTLQEEHRNVHIEKMFGAILRRATRRMQRKAEEGQPAHAGQRRLRLRLRGHPAAERLAAGDERQPRQQIERRRYRGAHRCLRDVRRIGTPCAIFHVGKLIAQRGNAALRQLRRE